MTSDRKSNHSLAPSIAVVAFEWKVGYESFSSILTHLSEALGSLGTTASYSMLDTKVLVVMSLHGMSGIEVALGRTESLIIWGYDRLERQWLWQA